MKKLINIIKREIEIDNFIKHYDKPVRFGLLGLMLITYSNDSMWHFAFSTFIIYVYQYVISITIRDKQIKELLILNDEAFHYIAESHKIISIQEKHIEELNNMISKIKEEVNNYVE